MQWVLPFFAVLVSALMVSRIPYPHVVNQAFRGQRSFGHVVGAAVCPGGDHVGARLSACRSSAACSSFRAGPLRLAARARAAGTRRTDILIPPAAAGQSCLPDSFSSWPPWPKFAPNPRVPAGAARRFVVAPAATGRQHCCERLLPDRGGRRRRAVWSSTPVRKRSPARIWAHLQAGGRVNLERCAARGDPLGGHFVTGHVDGPVPAGSAKRRARLVDVLVFAEPRLTRQMAGKGSVAVDGVSLTLVDVEPARFSVALIPHTLAATTLGQLAVGDSVNLETDLLAKYVETCLAGRGEQNIDRKT